MVRFQNRKKKPEKMPRGKDNGSLCSPACFPAKQERGQAPSVWDTHAAPSSVEKTGGRECYSNRCGRLRTERWATV